MKKLLIIFAVLLFAAPAMAADWDFYGSARMSTFYTIADSDVSGVDEVSRTIWDLQGNSRFGANAKVNDQISGSVEYGAGPNRRKLFGKYTMAGGSEFLIGQTYTPVSTFFYSNSVYDGDGDLLGIGQFYASRIPMAQFKTGNFKIAAVKPNTPGDPEGGLVDLIFPKIEAAFAMKGDAFFADVYGGFQTYDLDFTTGKDPSVTSYVVGIGGGMNLGALYFNAGAHLGRNLGQYGAYNPNLAGARAINISGSFDSENEIDNDAWGALVVAGMNVSDTWTFEVGAGMESAELDVSGADTEDVYQIYANAVWNIVPGFFIVPEIGYASYDYDDAGEDDPNPNLLYVGAKWQINF